MNSIVRSHPMNLTTYGFREFGRTVEVVPSIPKPPEKREIEAVVTELEEKWSADREDQ